MAADHNEASQFEHFSVYDWEADEEFQDGLRAILNSNAPREQAADLTLQAKSFYYSRKFNVAIDPIAYQSWVERSVKQNTPPESRLSSSNISDSAPSAVAPITDAEAAAPYPTSFSQIVELITQGKPVPGVKEVPQILLTGQESQSTTAKRKKPWEQRNVEEVANDGESKKEVIAG